MAWRIGWTVGVASVVATMSGSAVASESAPSVSASESRSDPWGAKSETPYVRLELDATGTHGVWPNPSMGGEVAILAGRPRLHARVGVGAVSTPSFALGDRGRVGAVLEKSDLEGCTAAHVRVHRLRLCAGVQAGVMHLRWSGFAERGRRDLPWFAAVGGASYGIALGRLLDLHAGIGLGVPIVRPRVAARAGSSITVQPAGPVFTTFRLGLGFKLG